MARTTGGAADGRSQLGVVAAAESETDVVTRNVTELRHARRWRMGEPRSAYQPCEWRRLPGRLRGCLAPSLRLTRSSGGGAARFGAGQTGQRFGGGRARANVWPSRDRPAGSASLASPTRVTAGGGRRRRFGRPVALKRCASASCCVEPIRPQGDGARRSWGRAGHTEPPHHVRCRRRSARAG